MKNHYRHLMSFCAVIFATMLLIGSGKTVTIARQTFLFDHAPKGSAAPGSAKISIAVVKPYYAENMKSAESLDLFSRYRSGLGGDIEEILIAKGFTLKGPFDTKADMTYNDKKTAELALDVKITPRVDGLEGLNATSTGSLLNAMIGEKRTGYRYSGMVSLGGRIEITAYEPMTGEKLWTKSTELPQQSNIAVRSEDSYYAVTFEGIMNDVGFYNPIGQALQKSYETVLNKVDNYIEQEEFKALLPQVKELKSRK